MPKPDAVPPAKRGHRPVCCQADYYERLMEYERLRDSGVDRWDAERIMGLSESSGRAYERWYRRRIGLPVPQRGEANNGSTRRAFIHKNKAGAAWREYPPFMDVKHALPPCANGRSDRL